MTGPSGRGGADLAQAREASAGRPPAWGPRAHAIAMWDFSWLLRHQAGGEFADWGRVLDELMARGYDAIRLDAFPQFIGRADDGSVRDEVRIEAQPGQSVSWGNQVGVTVRPRDGLLEFLGLCRARGLKIVPSAWFLGHGTNRTREFTGADGFVRAWDDVLRLLDAHGLLRDVLYVDLLNEFPLWHDFAWLKDELGRAGASAGGAAGAHVWQPGAQLTAAQAETARNFAREVIARLRAAWPALRFTTSLTFAESVPWREAAMDGFGALDVHVWAVHHPDCARRTSYFKEVHSLRPDGRYAAAQAELARWWRDARAEITAFLDAEIGATAERARALGIPAGNTEGWGPINWTERADLDWTFVKEAGALGVSLARKHGFKFICTSNFTHPQFRTLWADVGWHRELTSEIRRG